jgi:hypothetical protein
MRECLLIPILRCDFFIRDARSVPLLTETANPQSTRPSDCRLGLVPTQVVPFFRVHILYGLARYTHRYLVTNIQDRANVFPRR